MVLLLGVVYGAGATKMDADGNPVVQTSGNYWLGLCLQGIRFLCMASMYGGITVMIVGMTTMSPENVKPYDNEPLIPGTPVSPPPTPGVEAETFLVQSS